MEWFKNLKVASKLYLMIGLASFFILLTSVIGFSFNQNAANNLNSIYSENLVAIDALGDIRGNLMRALADSLNLMQNTTPAETIALENDIQKMKDDNAVLFKKFLATNPAQEQVQKLDDMKQVRTDFWKISDRALSLAKQNKNAEAYALYKSNAGNEKIYRTTLLDLMEMQKEASKKVFEETQSAAQLATILLIIIGVSSLVMMMAIGVIIANGITRPIQRAIEELTVGSSEVSAASSQVEAASQSLAEGTQEQAASIQETSSTLEETSSMVQQNNDNTKQAATMAKNAKAYAQKSNTEMSLMMKSMDDLKHSSNEIAKIIKVIDEIAFQTNLLSLNAAVEAARAGDAGKGFAVVAEEVRNLAQRSAQAAKDTTVIIESNIALSENSVKVAKEVNDSLALIDDESRKVSELLEEISTATEEQARGVNEINKAIQQMESVMQSNASTADESAAASRELASQAINVNDIVQSLIRLVEGVDVANAQSQKLLATGMVRKTRQISSRNNPNGCSLKNAPEEMIPLGDF